MSLFSGGNPNVWTRVGPPGAGFSVEMPAGAIKGKAKGAITFTKQAKHEGKLFTCMFSATRGGDSVEASMAPIRQMATEVRMDEACQLAGQPAQEFIGVIHGQVGHYKLGTVDGNLISLAFMHGPNDSFPLEVQGRFMDSFAMTPAD